MSFLFSVVFALVCICDTKGIFWSSLISAFIHETGHIFMMIVLKIKIKSISFRAFGVDIVAQTRNTSRAKQVVILCAGAFFNIIGFVYFYVLYGVCHIEKIKYLLLCNLSLSIFNLLPIPVLDGGQIVYIIFSAFIKDKNARKLIDIISYFLLFVLFLFGFMLVLKNKYNFSLLLASIYMLMVMLTKQDFYLST